MTKQEWIEAEKHLSQFTHLEFMCDEYALTIYEMRYKNRIVISFYVNGWFKGIWYDECEERSRFFRKIEKRIYKDKKVETAMKRLYKMDKKEFKPTFSEYLCYWTSFKSFKSHLIKNNKEIKWLNKPEVVQQ